MNVPRIYKTPPFAGYPSAIRHPRASENQELVITRSYNIQEQGSGVFGRRIFDYRCPAARKFTLETLYLSLYYTQVAFISAGLTQLQVFLWRNGQRPINTFGSTPMMNLSLTPVVNPNPVLLSIRMNIDGVATPLQAVETYQGPKLILHPDDLIEAWLQNPANASTLFVVASMYGIERNFQNGS